MTKPAFANRLAALLLPALLLAPTWGSAQAMERFSINGSRLSAFIVEPIDVSSPAPLVILMGGGPGNASISQDTSRWLGSGFAARGWKVVVPISPDNRSFRSSDNAALIEGLISELQKRGDIAKGKVLLAGVSNGGMSALGIAARNPNNYFGVAAVPALAGNSRALNNLKGLPVYLRIGGADSLGWAEQFADTVARLEDIGVDLDAAIIEGGPHMFPMEWETLEPWLESIKQR